ncbi:hypothetical protein L9F63_007615 [Diploptera punctata]|uniref:Single domain-containing protein n=1 Tax=Diploptera punctata TaxID=6984 RepID=A0AAD7Z7B9_DIPPU|nr:hypothetical protein L9F63_007615 [Diploptera punctata]
MFEITTRGKTMRTIFANKTDNKSNNKHTPCFNTINNRSNHYPPKELNRANTPNDNTIPRVSSTFYKCKDYITLKDHHLGEIWYNDTICEQYVCRLGEQNIPYTQTNRCGVFVGQPNCQIRQNYGKVYPSCCPVLYCNGRYKGPVIENA